MSTAQKTPPREAFTCRYPKPVIPSDDTPCVLLFEVAPGIRAVAIHGTPPEGATFKFQGGQFVLVTDT